LICQQTNTNDIVGQYAIQYPESRKNKGLNLRMKLWQISNTKGLVFPKKRENPTKIPIYAQHQHQHHRLKLANCVKLSQPSDMGRYHSKTR